MKEKITLIHPIFDNAEEVKILASTSFDFVIKNGYDTILIKRCNISKENVG